MRNHKHAITTKTARPPHGNAGCADWRDSKKNGDRRGIRVRRLLFFWVSLFLFLLTAGIVVLSYCWVMTWPKGGEGGFVVIAAICYLSMFAIFGSVVSLVLCAFAIPYFKGAIALFIVEIVALGYLVNVFAGFQVGEFLLPPPIW
jgi:hypothetical protein